MSLFRVEPLAPERTRIALRTVIKPLEQRDFLDDPGLADRLKDPNKSGGFAGGTHLSTGSLSDKLRRVAGAGDFVAEDKRVAGSIQRGIRCSRFAVGAPSRDYDASIEF